MSTLRTNAVESITGTATDFPNSLRIQGTLVPSGSAATEPTSRFPYVVGSVAELREGGFPAEVKTIYLNGISGVDDTGGGVFYRDSSDDQDNGFDVFVDANNTRWKRAPLPVVSDFDEGVSAQFLETTRRSGDYDASETSGPWSSRGIVTARFRRIPNRGFELFHGCGADNDKFEMFFRQLGDNGFSEWRDLVGAHSRSLEETFTVGQGGDFSTLNQALRDITRRSPVYREGGVRVTLSILGGYVEEEGVSVRALDLSWIRIISDNDSIIQCDTPSHLFLAQDNACLPFIEALFDMQGLGSDGISLRNSSKVIFSPGSEVFGAQDYGVINAGGNGLLCRGASQAYAHFTKFDNASDTGIFADHASTVHARWNSSTNCGVQGYYAHQASTINARHGDVSGAGSRGAQAFQASTINIRGGKANDVTGGIGLLARQSSTINGAEAEASRCDIGVESVDGGTLNFSDGSANDCQSIGGNANHGGRLTAARGYFLRAGNNGIRAGNGGDISVSNGDCRTVDGQDNSSDMVLNNGGIIKAHGAQGGSASAANAITFNGIMLRD